MGMKLSTEVSIEIQLAIAMQLEITSLFNMMREMKERLDAMERILNKIRKENENEIN